ncbi:MAG: DNA topoisomerase IB [Ferruginibacter sp.]
MIAEEILIKIPRKKIASIVNDPVKTAAAVNLKYVSDTEPGIERVKSGKGFKYQFENTVINDKDHLQRIKCLVIPPAWEQVWICRSPNGHLQATGLDVRKRKQYKYHSLWNCFRNQTKFFRLHEFGKALPSIRLQLERDLAYPGLPLQKVMATVVSLMERTHIRIGNNFYEKLYGSFGLSTLKDKHVVIGGSNLKFTFKGKKGVHHDISIKSKKLAAIVKQCRDIPGKELFQYYDDNGEHKSIDSGMINEYIKGIAGNDFTAKDFRTWAGTVQALLAFKQLGFYETTTESKKKIVEALDIVSKELGNTRIVCKKYYVHPGIIDMYENKSLEKYIHQLDTIEVNDNKTGLTAEEKIVMKILELN